MPTLHRSIDVAKDEARKLLDRFNVDTAYVVQYNRIYDTESNVDVPGFEAVTNKDLPLYPNIVATVSVNDA